MRDEQARLVLTAHPLQRVGAYAVAALARRRRPEDVDAGAFAEVEGVLRDDAVRSALVRDTKRDFWLKCSLSVFPNSPMAHPSNGKKDDETIRAAVRRWRTMPDTASWPDADCVLCGRQAVKFFGKVDVPLAESDIYRNTTPRGHDGMALCWPCVVSFHALPYGCRLTGGPLTALHSWHDAFLGGTTVRRVGHNRQLFTLGGSPQDKTADSEVVALQELRRYGEPIRSGVELLVFTNNNRGQALTIESMEQPLAEWLRRTMRSPQLKRGFKALLGAHWTPKQPAAVGLARNAFRDPARIPGAAARLLAERGERGVIPDYTADLAELCRSFAIEVMSMNPKDMSEIKATAARVATVLGTQESGGRLKEFYATLKEPARMRHWLMRRGVDWALVGPKDADGPLVTSRAMELLFDPDPDIQAWLNRQMLLVAVLEELHARGWRPKDGERVAEELDEEHGAEGLQALEEEVEAR